MSERAVRAEELDTTDELAAKRTEFALDTCPTMRLTQRLTHD